MKRLTLTFESCQVFLSGMTVHEKSWGSRLERLDWSCLYIHPGSPELIILFRTLYESKGLEFDDVSAISLPSMIGFTLISPQNPRFCYISSLKIPLWISPNGELCWTCLATIAIWIFLRLALKSLVTLESVVKWVERQTFWIELTKWLPTFSSSFFMWLSHEPERICG
jgi:hypothetical protein